MWHLIWPILITVAANTVYNITIKSTPANLNSFASLTVSYLVAAAVSLVLFLCTSPQKNLIAELTQKANWTTLATGVAIVGLEFGVLCIYRAGWKISVGNLIASVSLACMLVLVGLLLYKEVITLRQIVGIGVCLLGLYFLVK